jgi:uncharacterized protein YecT (DUF1311 family)
MLKVTKIVQITTTPIPKNTATFVPTLDPLGVVATQIAKAIGTPIVAKEECYKEASNQTEIDSCVAIRRESMETQMAEMVKSLQERYLLNSQEKSQKFLDLQSEWRSFSKSECEFRSGAVVIEQNGIFQYTGGSIAVRDYNECLVKKYQDRLRELQIELFILHQ